MKRKSIAFLTGWLILLGAIHTAQALTFMDIRRQSVDAEGLSGADAVVVSADDRFVYVSGALSNAISLFTRDTSSGVLTFSAVTSTVRDNLKTPADIALSPDGQYLYAVFASSSAGGMAVYSRGPDGTLNLEFSLDTVTVPALQGASGVTVNADSSRVYVTAAEADAVTAFDVGADGALTVFKTVTDAGNGLRGAEAVAISPDGRHVYVAASTDSTITVFDGNLNRLSQQKDDRSGVTGLGGAYDIAFSPDGAYVYTAAFQDGAVAVFARDAASGALGFIDSLANDGTTEGLAGVQALMVVPDTDGSQVIATGSNQNSVVVFTRNPVNGQLTFSEALYNNIAFSGVEQPVAVTSDSSGNHVYVAAFRNGAVATFSSSSIDLTTSVTGPAIVAEDNGEFSYQIHINNTGEEAATGVTMIQFLPPELTFVEVGPAAAGCRHSGIQITCEPGSLAGNSFITVDVTVLPTPTFMPVTARNPIEVSADQPDRIPANNEMTYNVQIVSTIPEADLQVSISDGDLERAIIDTAFTYTLTVENLGPDIENATVLVHELPAEAVFEAVDVSGCEYDAAAHTVTCNLGSVAVDSSKVVAVTVTAPATPMTVSSTARVSGDEFDPDGTNNQATQTTRVEEIKVDLVVLDVQTDVTTVDVGQELTYTMAVGNRNTEVAVGVTLTGTFTLDGEPTAKLDYLSSTTANLPPGSVPADQDPCRGNGGGVVTCALGDWPGAFENGEITMTVRPDLNGILTGTFNLGNSIPDLDPTNNFNAAEVTVTGGVADLVVTVVDEPDPVLGEDTVVYTVTVANNGPGDAPEVTLSNLINAPGSAIGVPGAPAGVTCGGGESFQCQLGTLGSGEEASITVPVTTGNETGVVTYTASAEQTGTNFDPGAPNTVSEETGVTRVQADVGIALEASPDPAYIGADLVYTATVTNISLEAVAGGTVLTVQLPPEVTFKQAEASQGACTEISGTVNCPLGSMEANSQIIALITVTPTTAGSIAANASVATSSFDPVPGNNTTSLDTAVNRQSADLQVTVEENTDPVLLGSELVYTVTVSNSGPSNAANVVLSGRMPATLTLNSVNDQQIPGCQVVNPDYTCRMGNIPVGDAVAVSFRFQALQLGSVSFSATAVSDVTDPTTPNTAVQDTLVSQGQILFYVENYQDGAGNIDGLSGVTDLAFSPDGSHLYASGFLDHGVAVFERDAMTGELVFAQAVINEQNGVSGIKRSNGVAVSDDGAYVYVAGFGDNALTVFRRDLATGSLSYLQSLVNGLNSVTGMNGPVELVTRGDFVYVAAQESNAITVFKRGADDRLAFSATYGSPLIPELSGISAVALNPAGNRLYAVSPSANTLTVFRRDTLTGSLSFIESLQNGINDVDGLAAATDVVVSSDGNYVYTAARGDDAIGVFRQDTNLVFAGMMLESGGGLSGVSALAMSGDGFYLYAAGSNANTLAVFRRDRDSGGLIFAEKWQSGSQGVSGLNGINSIAIGPDGGHVYTGALNDSAVALFRPAAADVRVTMMADAASAVVGENLTYTIDVVNLGPDLANAVVLEDILPPGVSLVSAGTATGTPCTADAAKVRCSLGNLENGAAAQVTVVIRPLNEDSLVNTAGVTSIKFDSAPDNNTFSLTTPAVGRADIQVSMRDETDPVVAGDDLTYTLQVSNAGPNNATEVTLTHTLPLTVTYIAATPQRGTCTHDTGVITCTIGALAPLTGVPISVAVKTGVDGTLTSLLEAGARQFDPDEANNRAVENTTVVTNIISEPYDNTGGVLRSPALTVTGVVTGGAVEGAVYNQGELVDVTILPDTTVTGGGLLSGTIVNQGLVENARLGPGATLSGGMVSGVIRGDALNPALLAARVAPGSQLTHVILDPLVQLDDTVHLGSGVQFAANTNIPAGLELTEAMPRIREPITNAQVLDLGSDVVQFGISLLQDINSIPLLRNNGLVMQQSPTGRLFLNIGDAHYVTMPLRLFQSNQPANVVVNPDNSVEFFTPRGRHVIAQPAVEDPEALRAALSQIGLFHIQGYPDGSLHLTLTQTGTEFVVRPEWVTRPVAGGQRNTLTLMPWPDQVPNLGYVVLNYRDDNDRLRQQPLYPVPADPEVFHDTLAALPVVQNLVLYNTGRFSLRVGALQHRGIFDYMITRGTPPQGGMAQFVRISDKNRDGVDDFLVVFPDGSRQVVYYLEPPTALEEIPSIPALQQGGYTVTFTGGNLLLTRGNERYLLKPGLVTQLPLSTPSGLTFERDGSVTFVTPSARRIQAQPLIQEMERLFALLVNMGADPEGFIFTAEENLLIRFGEIEAAVRPDPISLSSTEAPGLWPVTTFHGKLDWFRWVFTLPDGSRREQMLYPTAPETAPLEAFMLATPGLAELRIRKNGTLSFTYNGVVMRGTLDYILSPGDFATGNLQAEPAGDANRDGQPDFLLIHADGRRQYIYRFE